MSDEIRVSISGSLANSASDSFRETYSADQAAVGLSSQVQDCTTSDAQVDTGSIGTPGLLRLKNLDEANFIEYGPESGGTLVPLGQLLPGETNLLRVAGGAVVRWQADTATCKIETTFYEA